MQWKMLTHNMLCYPIFSLTRFTLCILTLSIVKNKEHVVSMYVIRSNIRGMPCSVIYF